MGKRLPAADRRLPTPDDWATFGRQAAGLVGRSLSADEGRTLEAYVGLLAEWNQTYNLVGPSVLERVLDRHLLDSLTLLPHLGPRQRVADLGSGAGLPGLVLGVFLDLDSRMDLIEGAEKKNRFLRHAVARLGLVNRVRVPGQRAELLVREQPSPYTTVVSRALGSLIYGAELAAPLLETGGNYLALKGERHEEEVTAFLDAPIAQRFAAPRIQRLDAGGVIVILKKVSRETH
ncbi:MAG: 16S rRNA (guanine(527)-N(7))-methyltransferase RsmG [Magnetococcales bacterium]|nr:16S rRNA (guanine(527)-N(7))-methyltransferase RsmG [Magnetococcales bacterium]